MFRYTRSALSLTTILAASVASANPNLPVNGEELDVLGSSLKPAYAVTESGTAEPGTAIHAWATSMFGGSNVNHTINYTVIWTDESTYFEMADLGVIAQEWQLEDQARSKKSGLGTETVIINPPTPFGPGSFDGDTTTIHRQCWPVDTGGSTTEADIKITYVWKEEVPGSGDFDWHIDSVTITFYPNEEVNPCR